MKTKALSNTTYTQAMAIIALADVSKECSIYEGTRNVWVDKKINSGYPHMIYDRNKVSGTRANVGDTNYDWITFEEFLECIMNGKIEIKLNEEYSATFTKGSMIEVGCQEFHINKIREVVKAYEELNS